MASRREARRDCGGALASLAAPTCWRREILWDLDFRLNVVRGLVWPRRELGLIH